MSALLTERQKTEMEEAIYEYLCSQGSKFIQSIEVFKQEAAIKEGLEVGKGLLEKKWISVLRLQVDENFSCFCIGKVFIKLIF
jgi:hypothetical protein